MAVDFKGYEKAIEHLKKYYDANPNAPYTGLNLLQGSNVFFRVSDDDPDVCFEKIVPVLKELEDSESKTPYKLALMRKNEKNKEDKAIAVSFYVTELPEKPEKSAAVGGYHSITGEMYYYKAKCEELLEKVEMLKEKNRELEEELNELETQHNELLEKVEKNEENMVGAISKEIVPLVVNNLPSLISYISGIMKQQPAPAQNAQPTQAINGIPDENINKYLDILFANGLTIDHVRKLAEMAQNNPGKFKGLLFML